MDTLRPCPKGLEKDFYFLLDAEGFYASDKPSQDQFLGTQGVARDITERKQLERATGSITKDGSHWNPGRWHCP